MSKHDQGSEFTTIAVHVERVDDVTGFPNLMTDVNHTTVRIAARDDRVRHLGLQTGDRIRCRTRRVAGDRFFAHPDSPEIVAR